MTETRRPAVVEWLTTVDHKRVGLAYLFTSLLFGAVAAGAIIGHRIELFGPGLQLLKPGNELQLYDLYSSSAFFLFLAPAFVGLAVFVVPLQLGARRVAFPRLQSLGYWLYLGGGGMVVGSFLFQGGPYAAQSLILKPVGSLGDKSSNLWIFGMGMVAVASVVAAIGLITTVIALRPPSLTLDRVRMFSWATLVSSVLVVVAAPVFLAGLVLHGINLNHGGQFFTAGRAGTVLWQHVLWLNGRPELFALLVMAAGAISEVVPSAVRHPLLAPRPALVLLAATAIMATLLWAYDLPFPQAPLAPTISVAASLAFLPLALLVLMWLGTLATGRPRPSAALAHAVAFVLVLAGALAAVVSALIVPVHGRTAWAEGHFAALFVAAPVLGLAAALHYWAPRLFGRHLSEALGSLQLLLLLAGTALAVVPFYTGLRDFDRFAVDTSGPFTAWNRAATIGVIVFVLGLLVLAANLLRAAFGRGRVAVEGADQWEVA
jgi:cytochrome c oxidase subunit I